MHNGETDLIFFYTRMRPLKLTNDRNDQVNLINKTNYRRPSENTGIAMLSMFLYISPTDWPESISYRTAIQPHEIATVLRLSAFESRTKLVLWSKPVSSKSRLMLLNFISIEIDDLLAVDGKSVAHLFFKSHFITGVTYASQSICHPYSLMWNYSICMLHSKSRGSFALHEKTSFD